MNLQENISRIREMMGILNEQQKDPLMTLISLTNDINNLLDYYVKGDVELYDFAEASGNFENITELIKWYKNFYLPHVQKFFDKHYNRILKYESEG